jgi:hypothetical protein
MLVEELELLGKATEEETQETVIILAVAAELGV